MLGHGRAVVVLAASVAVLATASPAQAITPTTTRIVNAQGQELNAQTYFPAISTNGRWVAFVSDATNAVPGISGRQVYLADRTTGEIRLASHSPAGAGGNGNSTQPTISGDGRYVVFQSAATNLGQGGVANGFDDVFAYDRTTGSVRRLSTNVSGNDGNDWSRDPRITSNGQWVVFTAAANDLVAGDTGMLDVFLVPIGGGAIERVSATPGGGTANGSSVNGDASDDGRYIAFASDATDLGVVDSNGVRDIYVLDRQTGQRIRASVTSAGGEAALAGANYASISADGCLVVFDSAAKNLVAGDDNTGNTKVYVRNRCTGNTEFGSLTAAGTQDAVSLVPPDISDDGCIVAFISLTTNVTLRDRCQGTTTRADVSTQGAVANSTLAKGWPRLSAGSGRYVVFDSAANNLVTDGNGTYDAFVRDRANAVPPTAALTVTVSGQHVTADASASDDPDAGIASVKISWGDGSADSAGVTGVHDYARGGTYGVTATVTDTDGLTATTSRTVTIADPGTGGGGTGGGGTGAGGGTGPAPGGGSTTPAALTLSGGVLSRTTFAVVPKGRKLGGRRGARMLLSVSDDATITLTFERVVKGHRRKGRCSATARRGSACTLYRKAGTVPVKARAGDVDVAITGRTSGGTLKPGTYRVTAVARAADGRVSRAVRSTFTIVRR